MHTLADAAAVASEARRRQTRGCLRLGRGLQSDTDLIGFSSNDVVAETLSRVLAPVSSGNLAPARSIFDDPIFESLVTLGADREAVLYRVALPVGGKCHNVTVAPFSAVNGVISPSVGG